VEEPDGATVRFSVLRSSSNAPPMG